MICIFFILLKCTKKEKPAPGLKALSANECQALIISKLEE